jgi:hypothetical protein
VADGGFGGVVGAGWVAQQKLVTAE